MSHLDYIDSISNPVFSKYSVSIYHTKKIISIKLVQTAKNSIRKPVKHNSTDAHSQTPIISEH